jgi:hypothetical protein
MHHATQLTSHNPEQFDTFRSPSLAQIRNPISCVFFFCRQEFPESLFSPRKFPGEDAQFQLHQHVNSIQV